MDLTDPTDPTGSLAPENRGSLTCMRVFEMVRHEDVTGFSGVGVVADGVEFPAGSVAFRWRGPYASTVVFDSINDVVNVHDHGGAIDIRWVGFVPVTPFQPWQHRDEPHGPWPTPDPNHPPVDPDWPPPDSTS